MLKRVLFVLTTHHIRASLHQSIDESFHLSLAVLLHGLQHGSSQLGRRSDNVHTSSGQSLELGSGSTLAARDDGAGMAHASAGRGRGTGDEGDDGLVGVTVGLQPLSSILLGRATNLTNHDDTLGLGVIGESLQAVNEVGSVERITANADAGGLTQVDIGSLSDSLVSQSTGARNDSDLSLLVDIAGHDTDLALLGLDNTGAVGADQSTLVLLVQVVLHL